MSDNKPTILPKELMLGLALCLSVSRTEVAFGAEKSEASQPSAGEAAPAKPARRTVSLPQDSSPSFFPRNVEDAPFVNPTPAAPVTLPTRKSMEEDDRRKNWLLYEVGNLEKTGSAEQTFEVENFGLPDDRRRHSVFERFVEGKSAADAKASREETPASDLQDDNQVRSLLPEFRTVPRPERQLDDNAIPRQVSQNVSERSSGLWSSRESSASEPILTPSQSRMEEFKQLFDSRPALRTAEDLAGGLGAPSKASEIQRSLAPPNKTSWTDTSVDQWKNRTGPRPSALDSLNNRILGVSGGSKSVAAEEPTKPKSKPAILPFPKREF